MTPFGIIYSNSERIEILRTDYDVIVSGGGPSGVAAAYAAAECGSRVLLVERSGRLGGAAIQSMVGPLMGTAESRIVDEILAAVGGRNIDFHRLDIDLFELLTGSHVTVLLHAAAIDVLKTGNRITGVTVNCREGIREFHCRALIDATGDGELAFRAKVPYEQGRTKDGLTQPISILFTVGNIDPAQRFKCGSEEEARLFRVGGRTWEERVLAARERGDLPETVGVVRLYKSCRADENIINAVQVNFLNGSCSADLTRAEIECRRQAFRVLEFLRSELPGYENACISAMPAAVGVRETRRFIGLARLEKEDCLTGRRFSDAAVHRADFPIDIHNPAGSGQAAGRDSHAVGTAEYVKPYDIPYGVMVPHELDGLLFTGRCISASHEALASCRVMYIAMALGAAAGAAAAYSSIHDCELRMVPIAKLAPILFNGGEA